VEEKILLELLPVVSTGVADIASKKEGSLN
jgi:hypothetical protein